VKEFLDGELAKYNNWEECRNEEIFSTLFANAGNFGKCKKDGVGRASILKFLKGAINEYRIESALDLINSNDIDIEAANLLGNNRHIKGCYDTNRVEKVP